MNDPTGNGPRTRCRLDGRHRYCAAILLLVLFALFAQLAFAQNGIPHSRIGRVLAGGAAGPNNTLPAQRGHYDAQGYNMTGIGLLGTKATSNNIRYADQYRGATADAKIRACLTDVTGTKGTCDARGIMGNQSIAATIAIPNHTTLLLGSATFTSTVVPVITLDDFAAVIGTGFAGSIGKPSTGIVLSGTVGGSAIQPIHNGGGSSSTQIRNLAVGGVSKNDGSVGIDLMHSYNGEVTGNVVGNFGTDYRIGGHHGECACYNWLSHNQAGGANIAYDFNDTANQNISILDGLQGGMTTAGFYMGHNGSTVANTLINPDIEGFGRVAIEIGGRGQTVYNPYIEAGGTAIRFDADAHLNRVYGGGVISSINVTTVDYTTADQTVNSVDLIHGWGIIPPSYVYAGAYLIPVGSSPKQIKIYGTANGSVGMDYVSGQAGETKWGLSGPARLAIGPLTSTGGVTAKGSHSLSQMSIPPTPTCSVAGDCSGGVCNTVYTYAVVCVDYNSNKTTKSAACSVPRGPDTLSSSRYVDVLWSVGTNTQGCFRWDIIGRADLTHSLKTNAQISIPTTPGGKYEYKDSGADTPAGYTPPTRNATGDLTYASGTLTNRKCVTIANLPATGSTGLLAGSMTCVTNWNGTVGTCIAASRGQYGIALYNGSAWTCH